MTDTNPLPVEVELEAALCAPTWAKSLEHVHAAIASLSASIAPPIEAVELAGEWATVRRQLTGLISDVECAIHMNEGIDALSGEAPDEARAGIERLDLLIAALRQSPPVQMGDEVERVAQAIRNERNAWADLSGQGDRFPIDDFDRQLASAAIEALSPRMDDVRNRVIEEAAKAAEDEARDCKTGTIEHSTAWTIAHTIRALSSNTRGDGG